MAHPMQHYGGRTPPTDGVLRVYAQQGDIPSIDRGKRNVVTIGSRTAGHRFVDVVFSEYALFEINNALRIIEWLRQLSCRFSETPAELQNMLNTINGEITDES